MAPFAPLTSSLLCSPETRTHSDGHARTGFANAVSRCVSLPFLFPSLKYLENITCQPNVRELQLDFASQTVSYDAGASPGTRAGRGLKQVNRIGILIKRKHRPAHVPGAD